MLPAVVDLAFPPMDRIHNIMLVFIMAYMMILIRIIIEESMMMRYYKFWDTNLISLQPEWIENLE